MHISSNTVTVDVLTLERTDLGLIEGVVFLSIDGVCFPEKQWYDFPVRLLGWWLDEIVTGLTSSNEMIVLSFMDGPYDVKLLKQSDGTWKAECIERGERERQLCEAAVDPVYLLKLIVQASDLTLARCNEFGWKDSDIEFLEQATKKSAMFLETNY